MAKKYYKCTVCQDIHYGEFPPEHCPTCKQDNKYVEVEKSEAESIFETN